MSKFSHKHYEDIARVIRNMPLSVGSKPAQMDTLQKVSDRLSAMFKWDKACGWSDPK